MFISDITFQCFEDFLLDGGGGHRFPFLDNIELDKHYLRSFETKFVFMYNGSRRCKHDTFINKAVPRWGTDIYLIILRLQ